MYFILNFAVQVAFTIDSAKQVTRCIDDCSKVICGDKFCNFCTSLYNGEERVNIPNSVMNPDFYERPEGICFNFLSSKILCQTDDNCVGWQSCITRIPRLKNNELDLADKYSICVATSPGNSSQTYQNYEDSFSETPNEIDPENNAFLNPIPPKNPNDINNVKNVSPTPISTKPKSTKKLVDDIHEVKSAINHEEGVPHARYSCSNDACSGKICGEKTCSQCTFSKSNKSPSGQYFNDKPQNMCFNQPKKAFHCESNTECEPWQVCLTRANKDYSSTKKFCVDTQPKNLYRYELTLKYLNEQKEKKKIDKMLKNNKFSPGEINSADNVKSVGIPFPDATLLECPNKNSGKKRCPKSNKRYPFAHTWTYDYHRIYDVVTAKNKGKKVPKNKYYLSIIAIFRNEALAMKEWIEHHLGHGVEHFYLVDDRSTDNSSVILEPYIKRNLVSMYTPNSKSSAFRQTGMYKKVFTDVYMKNESNWIAIIDLDEFLYSPIKVDIRDILRDHEDLSIAGVNWLVFGSNGLEKQPKSIIDSFTKRGVDNPNKYKSLISKYKSYKWQESTDGDWQKSIVNTRYMVDAVDVHQSVVEGTKDNLSVKRYGKAAPLIINHYIVQSKEFFNTVKGTRGDVNNWVPDDGRNNKYFEICDINEVPDFRLMKQNKYYKIAQNL